MRTVVLAGRGELALWIGQWLLRETRDWTLLEVVAGTEMDWAPSLRRWAEHQHVTVSEHHRMAQSADLLLSAQYDRIVDAGTLARYGRALNIHFAPLPKYRGVRPINWALKNGELEHGVTIHEMTPGIDDGAIVAQTRFTICPLVDEVAHVYQRCLSEAMELFKATMRGYDAIVPQPQDHALATYYGRDTIDQLGDRSGWTRNECLFSGPTPFSPRIGQTDGWRAAPPSRG